MKNKLFHIKSVIACCVLLLLFKPGTTNAQDPITNKRMQQIAKPDSKRGWIKFREDFNTNPENLFRDQKEAFDLGNDDEMKLKKVSQDKLGSSHYRYEQFYKGIRIDGAEYIVHSNRNGKVYAANGKMVNNLIADKTTGLPENAALELAKRATGAKHFKWENRKAEAWIKKHKKNAAATYFPKGELVWCTSPDVKGLDAKNYRLAWKFNIHADSTGTSAILFIDATNGKTIKKLPLEIMCDISTSKTTYDGTRNLRTAKDGDNYIMEYDCSGDIAGIHVYDAKSSQTTDYAVDYTDADNVWNTNYQSIAAQSMFSVYEALRYYLNVHERESYDDWGSEIEVYNNALFKTGNGSLSPNNASWSLNDEIMRVGAGSGSFGDEFNTIDILGHELTHGVVFETANLEYVNESGALNESFADIFGESIEYYSRGKCDWLLGTDKGDTTRSFMNPNLFGQPKYYYDSMFVPTGCSNPSVSNDFCGVHANSGVQNYWFYLLSVGGSGRNHNNRPFNIPGIGIKKAEKIAYRALTEYLTSNSNYYDAREATIHAAADLYGYCSPEEIQCAQAWYACSVGESLNDFNVVVCGYTGNISLPTDMWGINSVQGGGICPNIINTYAYQVNYGAGEQVVLLPGFTAQSGTHFNAYIEPCAVTNTLLPEESRNKDAIARVADNAAAQKISLPTETNIQTYPNPFTDQLRVEIKTPKNTEAVIRVFDISGREMAASFTKKKLNAGSNTIALNVSGMARGTYIINIEMNGEKITKKVLKQ